MAFFGFFFGIGFGQNSNWKTGFMAFFWLFLVFFLVFFGLGFGQHSKLETGFLGFFGFFWFFWVFFGIFWFFWYLILELKWYNKKKNQKNQIGLVLVFWGEHPPPKLRFKDGIIITCLSYVKVM